MCGERGAQEEEMGIPPVSFEDTSGLSCFPHSSAPGLETAGGSAWGDVEDKGESRSWCRGALAQRKELSTLR